MIPGDAQFVLASASPRRRALLAALGLRFAVLPADIDESRWPDEPPLVHVQRLARQKASVVAALPEVRSRGLPVLAADTIVLAPGGQVLGKPADRADALAMLALLAGCTHRVLTAVAVVAMRTGAAARGAGGRAESEGDRNDLHEVVSDTAVTFRDIDAAEAAAYWDTGEPRDKAGAYGIQGLGGIFAERIDGSFTGVMGLPVAAAEALLRRAGVATWGLRGPGSRA